MLAMRNNNLKIRPPSQIPQHEAAATSIKLAKLLTSPSTSPLEPLSQSLNSTTQNQGAKAPAKKPITMQTGRGQVGIIEKISLAQNLGISAFSPFHSRPPHD
ncbi:hypothetical protein N7481_012028 [Penicillium waksmanii]|uniref:uncharacterized protein n=1 Tax=Penicillium waksmanii TaxID=69791 RepID=UPI0025488630|nr:uncharacterized protein N7481_012028 [Penicillium waksmanii]KAJ5965314.1 hypothetical protein N7481_012028 [Penicillium waksmanii]